MNDSSRVGAASPADDAGRRPWAEPGEPQAEPSTEPTPGEDDLDDDEWVLL